MSAAPPARPAPPSRRGGGGAGDDDDDEDERIEAMAEMAAMTGGGGRAGGGTRRPETVAEEQAILGGAGDQDRFEVVDESGELVMNRFLSFLEQLYVDQGRGGYMPTIELTVNCPLICLIVFLASLSWQS
jgi:hypothetical protein